MPTAADIDVATDAYVAQRYTDAATWKQAYPAQYAELRERMKIAIETAAKASQAA